MALFSKHKSSRDGLQGRCKTCCKAATAKYRADNPEKTRETTIRCRLAKPDMTRETKAKYRASNLEKIKAYHAKYNSENSNEIKATHAAYYIANTEQIKAAVAKWQKANPEKLKEITAQWHKANPDACAAYAHNRRAQSAGGRLSRGLSAKLFKLQKGMCPCCKQPLGDDYHMDHKMPLALGGSNTDDNMQLLRAKCNMQKNAKHPIDFMQSRGFLL